MSLWAEWAANTCSAAACTAAGALRSDGWMGVKLPVTIAGDWGSSGVLGIGAVCGVTTADGCGVACMGAPGWAC